MKKLLFLIVFFIGNICVAEEVVFNGQDGLISLKNNNAIILTSKYIAWANKWKWDGPKITKIKSNNIKKELSLHYRKQNIISKVKIEKNKSIINYQYEYNFKKYHAATIGAGIEFNIDLQSQIRVNSAKVPYLLSDKTGWGWEFKPGKVLEVKFSRPVAKLYFEKEKKSKIRVLFFSGEIKQGNSKIDMSISVPRETPISSFDASSQKNTSNWLVDPISSLDSYIDLSHLNEKPAGKHGFVKTVGDQFIFSDKTPIRFYGVNVQARTLFLRNKKLIQQHAKRIAKLGFNLVRLHHHDSPWVKPSLIKRGNTTQLLDSNSLDSYFWWVKCLKDEGVYVWVDLQVQRPWRKGDRIPGWNSDMEARAKNGMNVGKGLIYLNKRMQQLSKKFNKEFLTRINPYTKLSLKDDPAVMGMMITNENDITQHYGNAFLKNKGHPYHQSLFDNEVRKFSERYNLKASKVRETWKAGSSKILLNDLEARFNIEMIRFLREIGVNVPISTTSLWGKNSALYSLPALSTGDIVDAHSYTSGNIFKKNLLQKDPRYNMNFLHSIGQAQVLNKPLTVTEYNVDERSIFNSAYIPSIAMASMAAFQGWDAIMLYGYSQNALRGRKISPWSSYKHPSIIGVMPAMAMLYREGHIMQAKQTVVLAPTSDKMFLKKYSPSTSAAIRTTLEQHRLVTAMPSSKNLPWLQASKIPDDSIILHDLNKDMIPTNQNFVESDTKEIRRDWIRGILTVNTKKSQLAMGHLGGHVIKLKDVTINSNTVDAAIIFTSLDEQPIKKSKRILISAIAKVSKIKKNRKDVFISEVVNAGIVLSSTHKDLRVIALLRDGSEGERIQVRKNNKGEYAFSLSEDDKTHWYLITK